MTGRVAGWGVVCAAAVAGLMFTPVFGFTGLVVPIVLIAVVAVLVDEVALRSPALARLRSPLVLVPGLIVLWGVVARFDWPAFVEGVVNGWLSTLESTWPARPSPRLTAFVPVLALFAAALGLEFLRRRGPLPALAPSLVVVLVAQGFSAQQGVAALAWTGAYVAAAVAVLASPGKRSSATYSVPVLSLVVALSAVTASVPVFDAPASLRSDRSPQALPAAVVSPFNEVGMRLGDPDRIVFRVRTEADVDRWTSAVFDRYDGVTWSSAGSFRALGAALPPDPAVTGPTTAGEALVTLDEAASRWLPTHGRTVSVDGVEPAVDPGTGVLFATGSGGSYRVTWQAPEHTDLANAVLATDLAGTGALDGIPAGLDALAREAAGEAPPSVATALVLEKWFQDNYAVADGEDIPSGHAYPQLLHFLSTTKRGTSEQFAASYAVLARLLGIPVRVAVGFRDPGGSGERVVRNGDVFAWPEILLAGRGWLALDPSGTVAASVAPETTPPVPPDRQQVPDASDTITAPPAADTDARTPQPPAESSWGMLWLAAAVVLCSAAAAPAFKVLRRRARRRGAPKASVLGATAEIRDVLRAHGVPVTGGMTMREVAFEITGRLDPAVSAELRDLGGVVDVVLWSGLPAEPHHAVRAWRAVSVVRRHVKALPRSVRWRALVRPPARRR
ncbi:DUF3488 and transglutaminase-like domain-containing protein [Saccharothrix longispora]|uniref:DUF3488 and transglutaminase-like domain-containing protein n=1 Tax=Saccharothrix longispora TaxID=33920 RepID=UPI0028FD9B97|nr:transglutaminaseTgpA domain-containing protein [Saccharothrix longispora]MDU0292964.1 transglutaminaseTgpA domain-containing protein [Saccharothrix longispora]